MPVEFSENSKLDKEFMWIILLGVMDMFMIIFCIILPVAMEVVMVVVYISLLGLLDRAIKLSSVSLLVMSILCSLARNDTEASAIEHKAMVISDSFS